MKLDLEDLSNGKLFDLIKSSVDILKKRYMPVTDSDLMKEHLKHLKTQEPEKKKQERGPRGHYPTDYTELDKIIKKHYGKKSSTGMIIIASTKGIKANKQLINRRRIALRLKPHWRIGRSKGKLKKEPEDEYLKLIEESSSINLEGLNQDKENLKDIQSEAKVGDGNPYE